MPRVARLRAACDSSPSRALASVSSTPQFPRPFSRQVHQLDAEQLDGELADLLREKLSGILQNVGGTPRGSRPAARSQTTFPRTERAQPTSPSRALAQRPLSPQPRRLPRQSPSRATPRSSASQWAPPWPFPRCGPAPRRPGLSSWASASGTRPRRRRSAPGARGWRGRR